MVNLLIVGVSNKHSEIIKNAVQQIEVDHLYMIVTHKDIADVFAPYATESYLVENIVKGQYSDEELDAHNCIPLDDTVFDYMNSYLLEILDQQRRYEQHHEFPVQNTWENHYETYLKNLYFAYNLLKRKKITHIFIPRIPHQGYDAIIYHLGQMLGIQIEMAFASLIPHRDFAMSDYRKADEMIQAEYERLKIEYRDLQADDIKLEGDTKVAFEKWTSLDPAQMKPFYMQGNKMKKTFQARYGTTNIINAWRAILGKEYEKYGIGIKFVGGCFTQIPKLCKAIPITYKRWRYGKPCWEATKRMKAFYEEHAGYPKEGETYIYFALHYQPEATSNPLGDGAYCDQRIPLQILSRSIPQNMQIYVKAHPDQIAFFSGVSYYQDILRMPNVRLIKMECSTYDLMKNAFAVASLTGTACWESQFYGVPALLFGKSYKNASPLAYPVRTVEQCKQAIRDIEQGKKTTTLKELKLYTKAAHNLSYPIADVPIVFPQLIKELIAHTE